MRIWKYVLELDKIVRPSVLWVEYGRSLSIDMPKGAKIISFGKQSGNYVIWALVDPKQPLEKRTLLAFPTGQDTDIPEGLKFVGTCLLLDDTFVLHLFEA